MFKKPIIVTHNENFHTDDVFSAAIFDILLKGKLKLVRTREEEIIEKADFVFDVGGIYDGNTRFDHHQREGAGQRENNVPYASVGLVWKKFGEKICGDKVIADYVDKKLIQYIDAQDNGFEIFQVTNDFLPYSISDIITSLYPPWDEARNFDRKFFEAKNLAKKILLREIQLAYSKIKSEEKIKEAYKDATDKRIVILDRYYPWKDFITQFPEPLFVIYPKKDNWCVAAVKKSKLTLELRKSFPESWGGKTDRELVEVSGIADALFCHRGLFLAVAGSKEGALALAKKAIEE